MWQNFNLHVQGERHMGDSDQSKKIVSFGDCDYKDRAFYLTNNINLYKVSQCFIVWLTSLSIISRSILCSI